MDTEIFKKYWFELSSLEKGLFEKYLQIFLEYNNHTNLSAIRDELGIIEKHFVDSLFWAEVISGYVTKIADANHEWYNPKLLDIGSGWWFPGIPLKIVIPDLKVTLLDSVWKKVKAMNFFIEQLWLENIDAVQERAEVLAKGGNHKEKYDFVVSRATAYITDILAWALPFLKADGKIILYKMPSEDEMNDLKKILKKFSLILSWELDYAVAGKERIILIIQRDPHSGGGR